MCVLYLAKDLDVGNMLTVCLTRLVYTGNIVIAFWVHVPLFGFTCPI